MNDYLPACKFVTTHGVRGELKALPLCDGADFLKKLKTLYAAPNGDGAAALAGVRAQGRMLLVRLAGVNSIEAARPYIGRTYYFAKAEVKLPRGRYFIDDLLGCTVRDADTGADYGTVTAVEHPAAQDVYTVTDAAGAEHMFPAVPEFLKSVDVAARLILVAPIPGMFTPPTSGDEG